MKREELIKKCRYYKGESENPLKSGDNASFWNYEKTWVDMSLANSDILDICIAQYTDRGLADFAKGDGIPTSLKALLYNRLEYWLECTPDEFMQIYRQRYYTHL